MNVLITSGGTTEKIDNVRKITNMSTGKLGSLIAASFLMNPAITKVFYVCSQTALKPEQGDLSKLEIIYADSVDELEAAVRKTLSNAQIDIIIHSMAVSDYRVKTVTTVSALLQNASQNPIENSKGNQGKISSEIDDMVLLMERTPKVIPLFQELSPNATLVGFKLLVDESLETLIDRGIEVLEKNKCTFVLANDLRDITSDKHIGYLIDRNKNFVKYTNKNEIATAIVNATIDSRK